MVAIAGIVGTAILHTKFLVPKKIDFKKDIFFSRPTGRINYSCCTNPLNDMPDGLYILKRFYTLPGFLPHTQNGHRYVDAVVNIIHKLRLFGAYIHSYLLSG